MNRNEYKTPNSIFTFGEIDDFCKEWGWTHIKEFIKQIDWIDGHEPPYIWSVHGHGQFLGIDGNKYMTHGTFRTQWVGNIKTDSEDKEKFKTDLKVIAGDYYWRNKKDVYYFYDVELKGGTPYNAWWMKEYNPDYIPNEDEVKYHGQPHWNVILWHMRISNGKCWGYTPKE